MSQVLRAELTKYWAHSSDLFSSVLTGDSDLTVNEQSREAMFATAFEDTLQVRLLFLDFDLPYCVCVCPFLQLTIPGWTFSPCSARCSRNCWSPSIARETWIWFSSPPLSFFILFFLYLSLNFLSYSRLTPSVLSLIDILLTKSENKAQVFDLDQLQSLTGSATPLSSHSLLVSRSCILLRFSLGLFMVFNENAEEFFLTSAISR